jgi:hypothetical protein
MALTKLMTELTYSSTTTTIPVQTYRFTIGMDQAQTISVRAIYTPTGLLVRDTTQVPKTVLDDIQTAIGQLEDLVGQTSAINGQLTYAAETQKSVSFVTAFANTNYRVSFSVEDYIVPRVVNKTVNGFTVEVPITYTGVVGYDVFV